MSGQTTPNSISSATKPLETSSTWSSHAADLKTSSVSTASVRAWSPSLPPLQGVPPPSACQISLQERRHPHCRPPPAPPPRSSLFSPTPPNPHPLPHQPPPRPQSRHFPSTSSPSPSPRVKSASYSIPPSGPLSPPSGPVTRSSSAQRRGLLPSSGSGWRRAGDFRSMGMVETWRSWSSILWAVQSVCDHLFVFPAAVDGRSELPLLCSLDWDFCVIRALTSVRVNRFLMSCNCFLYHILFFGFLRFCEPLVLYTLSIPYTAFGRMDTCIVYHIDISLYYSTIGQANQFIN